MRGLLIKDIKFTLKSKKMVAVFLLVAFILFTTQGIKNMGFITGYMTMIFGMLVLSTISSDEYDKCNAFFMTMPVNPDIYAAEKYVFSLGCSLAGWFAATVFCLVLQMNHGTEVLVQSFAVFLVMTLFQFIMLPVQLKFGGERGRMVLVGMIAFFMILAFSLKKLALILFRTPERAEEMGLKVMNWMDSLNRWSAGILAIVIWVICMMISLSISKRIMRGKEF